MEPGGEVETAVEGRTPVAAGTDGDGRFSQSVRVPEGLAAGELTMTVQSSSW